MNKWINLALLFDDFVREFLQRLITADVFDADDDVDDDVSFNLLFLTA